MPSFAAHCGIEDYNEDRCVILNHALGDHGLDMCNSDCSYSSWRIQVPEILNWNSDLKFSQKFEMHRNLQ
jgi:hypothetical protein